MDEQDSTMSAVWNISTIRTKDDYIRAYRAFCLRSRALKAYWLLLGFYVAYAAVRQLSRIAIEGAEADAWTTSTVELVVIYVLATWFTYSGWPRIVAGWEQDLATGGTIRIDENGLSESNPIFSLRANWRYFTEALESKDDFLLLRGPCLCRALPKRVFEDGFVDRFREMLRENIPKARLRKRGSDPDAASHPLTAGSKEETSEPLSSRLATAAREPGSVAFKLNWTKRDYKRAVRLFKRRSWVQNGMLAFVTLFMMYLVSDQIVNIIMGNEILLQVISAFPLFFIYVVFLLFYYFWGPALAARRAPDVGTEYDVEVSESGIVFEDALSSWRFGWQHFPKAVETRDVFLLFIGKVRFVFFPKRLLAGAQEIERLRKLIRRNVPQARLFVTSV